MNQYIAVQKTTTTLRQTPNANSIPYPRYRIACTVPRVKYPINPLNHCFPYSSSSSTPSPSSPSSSPSKLSTKVMVTPASPSTLRLTSSNAPPLPLATSRLVLDWVVVAVVSGVDRVTKGALSSGEEGERAARTAAAAAAAASSEWLFRAISVNKPLFFDKRRIKKGRGTYRRECRGGQTWW